MDRKTTKQRTLRLVQLAILLALVIVLQQFGSSVRVGPTSFSLVLIPIALGGMLLGPGSGAFLGLVFGVIVLLAGVFGQDAFTQILFQDHPFLTSLTCLGKGAAAGFVSGLLYQLIAKKNRYVASFAAAAAAPVVNTGLFILCALLMSDTLSANFVADGTTVIYFLVIGCAGINFLVEFLVNLLVSPALHMVVGVVTKQLRR
ncbi:MAG: ECF transporter S component [Clostridia bacterium]|nr:ECF transporter S component [Clostridia bacterium]